MPKIDYYFSTISPYTYLAGPRFRAICEAHGAEVNVKPFDIVGMFPRTGGKPLAERQARRCRSEAKIGSKSDSTMRIFI